MMFKILVADDEASIRKGILAILDRALPEEELEFVEASNGMQALELCHSHAPDLVISDIRMPGCDGLEFIRSLRQSAHSPEVLILSGFDDFTYAKSAISLGVKDYILKPIKKQEFIATVSGHIRRIRQTRQQKDSEVSQSISVRRGQTQLTQQLLADLLCEGEKAKARQHIDKLRSLGVRFENKLYVCALLQARFTARNADYIDTAIHNIAGEILADQWGGDCCVPLGQGRLAVILGGGSQNFLQDAEHQLRRVLSAIASHLKTDAFVGVGEAVYGSVSLHQSYESARLALASKVFGRRDVLVTFESLPAGGAALPLEYDALFPPGAPLDEAVWQAGLRHILAQGGTQPAVRAATQSWAALPRLLRKKAALAGLRELPDEPQLPPLELCWDADEMLRAASGYWAHVQEQLAAEPENRKGSPLFLEMLAYVRKNAAGDINLNLVAEQFSRSAGYVSALFKKETGRSFTDILTGERVRLAREMLAESGLPVAEISARCGYPNPKHFSSVFKKAMGQSPAAYRAQARIDKQI